MGAGGYFVLGDTLTAGTLVAFVLYVERFFEPIRELAQGRELPIVAMTANAFVEDRAACLAHLIERPDFLTG